MELFDAIAQRYSCRAYHGRAVAETDLQKVLQAANDAPTAGNLQAFEIVIVRDHRTRQRLAEAAFEQWFLADAPLALAFLANPQRNQAKYGPRGAGLYAVQDATIACAYAQLAATALGLATCWVGAFDDDAVRQLLRAPAEWRPVAVLSLGYAADAPRPHDRRPRAEVAHEHRP